MLNIKKIEYIKALCFLALVLFGSRLLSAGYSSYVMSKSLPERTEGQLAEAGPSIDVLITGDSHSKCGIDPDVLGNAFNYAIFNESYLKTYYKLKSLFEGGDKKIGTVIIPLDLHSFGGYRIDEFDPLHYWARYVDFGEVGRIRGRRAHYAFTGIRARFFSYVDNDQNVFWSLDDAISAPSERGLKMRGGYTRLRTNFAKRPQEYRDREISKRAGRHFGKGAVFDDDMAHYFRKLVELCEENGVRVAVVSLPIPKEYYDAAAKKISVDELDSKVAALLDKYPDALRLDYRNLFFDRTELFADTDHMNEEGAKILSGMLRDDLGAKLVRSGGM